MCTLHWSGSGSHDAGIRDAASPAILDQGLSSPSVSKQVPLGQSKTIVDRCTLLHYTFVPAATFCLIVRGVEISGSGLGAINNIDVLLHPSSV